MPKGKKISILIAEDLKTLSRMLGSYLEQQGFDVTLSFNGLEAKRALSKQSFDFLVTDIIMPEMDGLLLLKWMEQQQCSCKVIIVTGVALEKYQLSNTGNIILQLEKPYTPQLLDTLVETIECNFKQGSDIDEL